MNTPIENIIKLNSANLHLKSDSGDVHIIKDMSLSLPRNKTISIIGPSGSGKTTLLMLLSGIEKLTNGNIEVVGKNLSPMSEDELAVFRRDNIGIIFQNFHLIPTMTALENVAIPLELSGDKDAFNKAFTALKNIGLENRIKHYPGQLSGGEQQRVAIARAFVTNPKIILADEPTGNLDSNTGDKVMNLLFDMVKNNDTTLILVTHDSRLEKKCDINIKIYDGKII